MPLFIEGVDLDLRMRGFEFASFITSSPFDSPRPLHLKATGKIKFQGKIFKSLNNIDEKLHSFVKNPLEHNMVDNDVPRLVGEISLSGIKLNQLMLAPQLSGFLSLGHNGLKVRSYNSQFH